MKQSGNCRVWKPLDEFHRSTTRGVQHWCKECRRAYDRAYFARNRMARDEMKKCELVCANCHAVRSCERQTGRSSAW